jgi:FkbM family methyltransferase
MTSEVNLNLQSLIKKIKSKIRIILLCLRGVYSFSYIITRYLRRYYPRIFYSVILPAGIKIYINDVATLYTNIPDMYERREYFLYDDFVPSKDWVVADVGAYVGIYSLWASKAIGNDGLVISFEPNPLAYYWLKNNVQINKASNIITLPLALGDALGKMQLYVAKENIEATSFIPEHITRNPLGRYTISAKFNVPLITLDYFLEKAELLINKRIMNLDLVKIDVEGYELNVLKGAENSLKRGVIKRLVIEVHIDHVPTRIITQYLKRHGFQIIGVKHFSTVKDMVYAVRKC